MQRWGEGASPARKRSPHQPAAPGAEPEELVTDIFNPVSPAAAFDEFVVGAAQVSRTQRPWVPEDGALPALFLSHGAPPLLDDPESVSYTHLRAHETRHDLVCRLLLEKKKI